MDPRVRDVIVIGGGISGLTAAWHLKKAGADVCLLEADEEVGGCTRTDRRDGFLLEKGPFNVMVRDPAFEDLLCDLGDTVSVVSASKAARARFIYRGGRLHKVPTNPVSLCTTGLLSFSGRCRLMTGLVASRTAGAEEETIEQVATRRFGRETSDVLVSAVISGIFAGDISKLSLEACFPSVAKVDAEAGSLIGFGLKKALFGRRKKPARGKRRWRGLVSIDGGLGALTAAMGSILGSDLLTRCRVDSIATTSDGYDISYHTGDNEAKNKTIRARQLIVAAPAPEAQRLLHPLIHDDADVLGTIESSSLVVLSLAYRSSDVGHPLAGFGFLVPHIEPDFPLMGVLFADSIFPHHAPSDHRLIRVFIGGARDPAAITQSDDELLATATGALRDLLEIRGEPVLVDFCRYKAAIPQYHAGHHRKIERLLSAVATKPGLHLVGNYLEGVSLNDCVRLGTRVAGEIMGAGAEKREPQPAAVGVRDS